MSYASFVSGCRGPVVWMAAVMFVGVPACKSATLGPEQTGDIEGRVLHHETNEPLDGASVTTSPPSSAPVTNSDGRFRLEDLEVGDYSITARKSGFETRSISVSVREGRATEANVFLRPEDDDDDDEPDASLDVEITNWWNTTAAEDSVFVDVEYRVENTGGVALAEWEVFFEIHTPEDVFQHGESGADLEAGRASLGSFQRFIRESPADSVVVQEIWFEPSEA